MKKSLRFLASLAIAVPLFAGIHTAEAAQNDNVVSFAEKEVGVPYQWGGTTPSGFDCSGFTGFVYKHFNVQLPRTAAGQYGLGQAVSRSQLLPGDLVFFTTYTSGPSHVGIYVGDNNFIAASSSGIKIDSLDNSYYRTRYLGARRVLQHGQEQVKAASTLLSIKKGQIGQVNIKKGIKLWKRVNGKLVYVRGLNPGSRYRVYGKDNKFGGQFNLGKGMYVTNIKGYVDYISEQK